MANPDSTEFVGSHLKAKNGFGQNGYQGASSDTPGQHTTSDFLPQAKVPADDWQTRHVSAEPIKAHDGMANRSTASEKVPAANVRRSKTDGQGRPLK